MNHALRLNRFARGFARAALRSSRARLIASLAAGAAIAATGVAPLIARGAIGGLDDVSHLPTAMGQATARLASIATTTVSGRHLGFDTSRYPGDATMRAWRTDAPYEWVGYYLPAPCHKDDSWSGKRATLATMNWGMAVIYVGQQTWGRRPGAASHRAVGAKSVKRTGRPARATRVVRSSASAVRSCDASLVGASRGEQDADDAIAKTVAEGFSTGSVVFLDVEHMDQVPQAMRDYYIAWTRRVLADGRFRAGIYAHTHNADVIYADVRAAYEAAGIHDDPPFWIAGARDFSPSSWPSDVGHAFAAAWQGILDHTVSHAGIRLPIDVSVASAASPSEMYVTASAATSELTSTN